MKKRFACCTCTIFKVTAKARRKLTLLCFIAIVFASCKGPSQDKVSIDGTTVQTDTAGKKEEEGQKPSAIEVIVAPGKKADADSLGRISGQLGIPDTTVYQWKNHLVIYGMMKQPEEALKQVGAAFPGSKVKLYRNPFYEFNRQQCGDTTTAKQWDHVLLTANLVQDSVMQHQYLEDHATQKEKWPEVANGFCTASFQQLLLYKNERQLLLVISIPKGASLDSLNPKTTENNPRVNDWNAVMKKYQEGIPGTKKGEVWVFLRKVNKSKSQ